MGSVSHVEEERKELVKDVHRLSRLGVHLMSISECDVIVQNGADSSLVVEVRENQESNPIFIELMGAVNNQRVESFSQGGDDLLFLQKLITPGILFIQVPQRCSAICGKSIGGMA